MSFDSSDVIKGSLKMGTLGPHIPGEMGGLGGSGHANLPEESDTKLS